MTAEILASVLSVPWEAADGLEEHHRDTVPLLEPSEWERAVEELFETPSARVLGEESADQAHARFARAIAELAGRDASRALAVVTHGTVLSLFIARVCGGDAFAWWKRWTMPSYVVLSHPPFAVESDVCGVGDDVGPLRT